MTHSSRTLFALLIVATLASVAPPLGAATAMETPPVERVMAPAARPVGSDLREVLAATTRERNDLAERLESVSTKQWLLILYAAVATAVAMWFGIALLRRPPAPAPEPVANDDGDPVEDFAGTTATVRKRRNATITIRNAHTQAEEVVSNVETRRMFARSDSSTTTRKTTTRIAAAVVSADDDSELKPSTDRARRPTEPTPPPQPITNRRTVTVRVEHQSDRLAPVEVQVKPGTAAIARQGFSMLEIMIALAILATVLASVLASVYALHTAQVLSRQEARVEEIGRLLVERLMGAQWDSIGRRDQSVDNLGAWSWHRRMPIAGETTGPRLSPLREGVNIPADQNLLDIGLLSGPSELDDLKVYVEYYTRDVLDSLLTIAPNEKPHVVWADARTLYRIAEETPSDIAASPTIQTAPTLVFRVVITWKAYRGGDRQHEVVFARSK